ncbi:prolipoprotein diacylglyceryl transferase [Ligilactobacillus pobuzihii]|uniref:Phosphatidylglycerol--prolipoprotein diacylglyceryl transferase n=1 Tax=Ligilactobacillus pobuzihii TaxID=449659 RepID=A0A0R2LHA4_9LACO|nr:prolipoprotein diacylglyceryl transferase [Ligilactobacillus pobuzihii]KRK10535.1 Prolipoprotein diacylglyceryl transferase [Ligilactobacillus pobuzihii E100301 = KCTC 13174]KRN97428.1 Prolipoprotein diacylglyceryl transferase [Ligilactobacillus pobuzihii]GEN48093.1 prolipoprotein diacylglyceryl transferase [Ligilactobacillus pobuzihii]
MNLVLGALNPIALKFGPFEVRWYGVIIACSVILAAALSVKEGQKRGLKDDYFYDFLLWALPFSLIGARLYYVIFEWPYYASNPSEIYRIWDGGIAIYGGLIAAVIVLLVYCHSQEISSWLFLDVIAPNVILAQGIGRWGNFMNQEAHGQAITLDFLQKLHLPQFIIDQMNIGGVYYQPTFLYESLWDVLGFVVLLLLRNKKHLFKQGEVFFSYVIWYSFGRFFIEGMRTDSLMIGPLRVSQWLSVVLFIGAFLWLFHRRYWHPYAPWYLDGQKTLAKEK